MNKNELLQSIECGQLLILSSAIAVDMGMMNKETLFEIKNEEIKKIILSKLAISLINIMGN